MIQLDDIYVLLKEYDKNLIADFRLRYLKNMYETAEYYEYPPYFGKTEFETSNYEVMLDFIINNKKDFRFYFKNKPNNEIVSGMIFFNKDKSVLLGLQVETKNTLKFSNSLRKDYNSNYLMICNNVPPPNNIKDFLKEIL